MTIFDNENKIISYSFFEPKASLPGRTWDKYAEDPHRYYYNIPAVILSNRIIYPEYNTVFFITYNSFENPLSLIFYVLKDYITVDVTDMDYSLTEPSILRMIPVWENVKILLSRDVDSIPSKIEWQYSKDFEKSIASIGTIRTHENHYGRECCMLAGLSAFKPNNISIDIKGKSFEEYLYKSHDKYGCDQDIMIKTFISTNLKKYDFLDCCTHKQNNPQDFPCLKARLLEEPEDRDILDVFNLSRELGLDSWAGEPIDARGPYTEYLLNLFPEVKKDILKNKLLSKFYGVL